MENWRTAAATTAVPGHHVRPRIAWWHDVSASICRLPIGALIRHEIRLNPPNSRGNARPPAGYPVCLGAPLWSGPTNGGTRAARCAATIDRVNAQSRVLGPAGPIGHTYAAFWASILVLKRTPLYHQGRSHLGGAVRYFAWALNASLVGAIYISRRGTEYRAARVSQGIRALKLKD